MLSAKDIVANEALEKQLALGATYAGRKLEQGLRDRDGLELILRSLTRVRSEPSTLILDGDKATLERSPPQHRRKRPRSSRRTTGVSGPTPVA